MAKIEIEPYRPDDNRHRFDTDSEQDRLRDNHSQDQFRPDVEVRTLTTAGIRKLLQALEPYVDGTLGDVSPRHAQLYLKGLQELNRIWSARYLPPPLVEDFSAGIERTERTREKVLGMLDQLRNRGHGA